MDMNGLSDALPPDFPPQLRSTAFVSGEEVAWRPIDAIAAVEWFGEHGYAVLGTELWLLQDNQIQSLPIGLTGLREVHGNVVDRMNEDDTWDFYVARVAAETLRYLRSFNPADILEKGDLHFQVTWISKNDYQNLHH